MTTVEHVQHIYAAFGRGDVPAILECLAEDVEWGYGTAPNPVPWLQRRQGRAQVAGFFQALSALDFQVFAPLKIFGDERFAISMVQLEATVRATGRQIIEPAEVHIWHFDDRGLVARFRHAADTWQQAQALQPA
jgi:ketosteroid isomerase-like protein